MCKGLTQILAIPDIPGRLHQVALLFKEKEGIKLNFCRIYGKRWSYIAGEEGMLIPEKKVLINQEYGIIIENNTLEDRTWDALVRCFRNIIEE